MNALLCRCFAKLCLNVFFRESPGLCSQHVGNLLLRHANLVTDRHQTAGQMQIVVSHQAISELEVVYLVKDKRSFFGVGGLGGNKVHWMFAPMSPAVQICEHELH